MAADEITQDPCTVFSQQDSGTGSALARGSRHIQLVDLGDPRAIGRGECLDGQQKFEAFDVDTAHGEELPVEHREARAACIAVGRGSERVRTQHKPLRSPPTQAARVPCSSLTDRMTNAC